METTAGIRTKSFFELPLPLPRFSIFDIGTTLSSVESLSKAKIMHVSIVSSNCSYFLVNETASDSPPGSFLGKRPSFRFFLLQELKPSSHHNKYISLEGTCESLQKFNIHEFKLCRSYKGHKHTQKQIERDPLSAKQMSIFFGSDTLICSFQSLLTFNRPETSVQK
jgi:hypothetical protein